MGNQVGNPCVQVGGLDGGVWERSEPGENERSEVGPVPSPSGGTEGDPAGHPPLRHDLEGNLPCSRVDPVAAGELGDLVGQPALSVNLAVEGIGSPSPFRGAVADPVGAIGVSAIAVATTTRPSWTGSQLRRVGGSTPAHRPSGTTHACRRGTRADLPRGNAVYGASCVEPRDTRRAHRRREGGRRVPYRHRVPHREPGGV